MQKNLLIILLSFDGKLIIQTLFLRGVYNGRVIDNTTTDQVNSWLIALKRIKPSEVMIYTISRDTPEGSQLSKVPLKELRNIAAQVEKLGIKTQVSVIRLNNNQNILICPLEWGLGHASRMIPLARRLCEMNNNIFLVQGKIILSFFRNELPGLTYIDFPGFKPGYSRLLPQYIPLLLQTPVMLYHIIAEHFRLKKIVKEYKIDIVISDNRFGLWNKKIKTVYVTHMPLIPFPGFFKIFEFIGIFLHRIIIKQYSYCFIPDLPGEINLSGRLSHLHNLPDNVRYIGILSRFAISEDPGPDNSADLPIQ